MVVTGQLPIVCMCDDLTIYLVEFISSELLRPCRMAVMFVSAQNCNRFLQFRYEEIHKH